MLSWFSWWYQWTASMAQSGEESMKWARIFREAGLGARIGSRGRTGSRQSMLGGLNRPGLGQPQIRVAIFRSTIAWPDPTGLNSDGQGSPPSCP